MSLPFLQEWFQTFLTTIKRIFSRLSASYILLSMSETKLYNGSDMFSVIGVGVGFERSQLLYIVHNQFNWHSGLFQHVHSLKYCCHCKTVHTECWSYRKHLSSCCWWTNCIYVFWKTVRWDAMAFKRAIRPKTTCKTDHITVNYKKFCSLKHIPGL